MNGQPDTYFAPAYRQPLETISRFAAMLADQPLVEAIMDTMPGPALVLNTHRQVVAANNYAYHNLTSLEPTQCLGMRPGELVGCLVARGAPSGCGTGHACAYCGLLGAVLESMKTGLGQRSECLIAVEEGDDINMEVLVTPSRIKGEPFVFVGLRDISDTKRREALERTFFHDLLNTVTGLMGLAELFTQEDGEGEHTEHYQQLLLNLSRNLMDEITAHRELLAGERGTIKTRVTRIETIDFLNHIAQMYGSHPVGRGRHIQVLGDRDVGLFSDTALLSRVVGNLVKNALEASLPGETVSLCALEEPPFVRLDVHNRAYLPREVQLQLFRRSFSTKGAGRGLGTYSVRLFTERYLGGHVSVTSDREEGTVFSVLLPRELPGAASAPPPEPCTRELPNRCLRLLLVEDNPVNQLITSAMLQHLGCVTDVADSGQAALERTLLQRYDLVFMDLLLPDQSGLEVTAAMRRQPDGLNRDTPVVALTAAVDEQVQKQCAQAGMCGVGEKPVTPGMLAALLKNHAR